MVSAVAAPLSGKSGECLSHSLARPLPQRWQSAGCSPRRPARRLHRHLHRCRAWCGLQINGREGCSSACQRRGRRVCIYKQGVLLTPDRGELDPRNGARRTSLAANPGRRQRGLTCLGPPGTGRRAACSAPPTPRSVRRQQRRLPAAAAVRGSRRSVGRRRWSRALPGAAALSPTVGPPSRDRAAAAAAVAADARSSTPEGVSGSPHTRRAKPRRSVRPRRQRPTGQALRLRCLLTRPLWPDQLLVAGLRETLGSECQCLSLPQWCGHAMVVRTGAVCAAASGSSPRLRSVEGAPGRPSAPPTRVREARPTRANRRVRTQSEGVVGRVVGASVTRAVPRAKRAGGRAASRGKAVVDSLPPTTTDRITVSRRAFGPARAAGRPPRGRRCPTPTTRARRRARARSPLRLLLFCRGGGGEEGRRVVADSESPGGVEG